MLTNMDTWTAIRRFRLNFRTIQKIARNLSPGTYERTASVPAKITPFIPFIETYLAEEKCPVDGSGLGSLDASLPHFGGDRRELPAAGGKEANQISGKGVKKARLMPDTKATKNVID